MADDLAHNDINNFNLYYDEDNKSKVEFYNTFTEHTEHTDYGFSYDNIDEFIEADIDNIHMILSSTIHSIDIEEIIEMVIEKDIYTYIEYL